MLPRQSNHTVAALQAYQSVKPRIIDIVSEIVGECVNEPEKRPSALKKVGDHISGKADDQRWRIFVTGHSMGGSKATLCAYELAVWLSISPSQLTRPLLSLTQSIPFIFRLLRSPLLVLAALNKLSSACAAAVLGNAPGGRHKLLVALAYGD